MKKFFLFGKNKHTAQRIGLTGGIASGKSTVSARLASLGAYVIDADAISRDLTSRNGACFQEVAAAFPQALDDASGQINRKRLAGVVFHDASALEKLNAIVHPKVIQTMHSMADAAEQAHPGALIIYDVPLLVECGLQKQLDALIVVAADDDVRIERMKKRNGYDAAQAKARIDAQMPLSEKICLADYVLLNNGSLPLLYQQVDALYEALTEHANKD